MDTKLAAQIAQLLTAQGAAQDSTEPKVVTCSNVKVQKDLTTGNRRLIGFCRAENANVTADQDAMDALDAFLSQHPSALAGISDPRKVETGKLLAEEVTVPVRMTCRIGTVRAHTTSSGNVHREADYLGEAVFSEVGVKPKTAALNW